MHKLNYPDRSRLRTRSISRRFSASTDARQGGTAARDPRFGAGAASKEKSKNLQQHKASSCIPWLQTDRSMRLGVCVSQRIDPKFPMTGKEGIRRGRWALSKELDWTP